VLKGIKMMRILIVEDDEKLCELLAYQLKKEGIFADCCFNGGEAMLYIEQNIYDLLLLDRMLPEKDGITILRGIRQAGISTPVILITALGQLQDKVEGLDTGADDYLVKPFAFRELMARIRSISRRPRKLELEHVLRCGDMALSPEELTLTGPGGSCSLSKRECALLEAFLGSPDHILQRNTLLLKIWGPGAEVEDSNLDNYIHFLRRRIASVGSAMKLSTARGVGYRLDTTKNE